MTNKEIENMLKVKEGMGVYYDHAPKGTKLPFITFTTGTSNFFADNKTYKKIKSLRVVLYTHKKDEQLETMLENAFNNAELPWNMTDSFEQSEEVFSAIYESEVI